MQKHQLISAIGEGNLPWALTELDALLSNTSHYQELILLKSQYNTLQKSRRAGTISAEHENINTNRITSSVLSFIEELDASLFSQNTEGNKKIRPILVLSDSQELRQFFQGLDWGVYQLQITWHSMSPCADSSPYEIVLFDNRDLNFAPNASEEQKQAVAKRETLFRYYTQHEGLFFIHLGEFWPLMNQFRKRTATANAEFTLYVWLKELLQYLEAFTVK